MIRLRSTGTPLGQVSIKRGTSETAIHSDTCGEHVSSDVVLLWNRLKHYWSVVIAPVEELICIELPITCVLAVGTGNVRFHFCGRSGCCSYC